MSKIIRWIGRRFKTGSLTDKVDSVVLATKIAVDLGRLAVAPVYQSHQSALVSVPNGSWQLILNCPASSPQLLVKLEIYNPTAGALAFRFGLRASLGTPNQGHAFIAWNTSLASLATWAWNGQVPLDNRYLYVYGGGPGLLCYVESQSLTVD